MFFLCSFFVLSLFFLCSPTQVRLHGFNIKGKSKEELIKILSKCLRYERRYFPIRTTIRVSQIERELMVLMSNERTVKRRRTLLMNLWVEAYTIWSPLKLHLIEEKKREHYFYDTMIVLLFYFFLFHLLLRYK